MKADKIKIQNLEVFANHGVFPEENVLGQKFVVSAVLYTDTRKAGQTDELTASIHYGEVSAFIDRYLKEHTFNYWRRWQRVLQKNCFYRQKGFRRSGWRSKKPWAPVGLPLETVSVEMKENGIRHILHLDPISGRVKHYLKRSH